MRRRINLRTPFGSAARPGAPGLAIARSLAVVVTVGCAGTGRVERAPLAPELGLSVTVIRREDADLAIVEDRRIVEIDAGGFVLDRIDARARLSTLSIEPLDGRPLVLAGCAREVAVSDDAALAVTLPELRCRVSGTLGRRAIRVVHEAPSVIVGGATEIVVGTAAHASVSSSHWIAAPRWGVSGRVRIFESRAGTSSAPALVAAGAIAFDGTKATVGAGRTSDVPARLSRVHAAAPVDGDPGGRIHGSVWVWLEVDARLPRVPTRVRVTVPSEAELELVVPAHAIPAGEVPRLRLWLDDSLRVTKIARGIANVAVTVYNHGEVEREIWIEEPTAAAERPRARRRIRATPPSSVQTGDDVTRIRAVVGPRGVQRVTYAIDVAND